MLQPLIKLTHSSPQVAELHTGCDVHTTTAALHSHLRQLVPAAAAAHSGCLPGRQRAATAQARHLAAHCCCCVLPALLLPPALKRTQCLRLLLLLQAVQPAGPGRGLPARQGCHWPVAAPLRSACLGRHWTQQHQTPAHAHQTKACDPDLVGVTFVNIVRMALRTLVLALLRVASGASLLPCMAQPLHPPH
jgi:hypothetical protein